MTGYYLLVLYSFTGLSSLLGLTSLREHSNRPQIVKANESKTIIQSNFDDKLQVPPRVLQYVWDRAQVLYRKDGELSTSSKSQKNTRSKDDLILIQRYDFNFAGFLSVIMFHFQCPYGRRHLVEVYDTIHPIRWFNDVFWKVVTAMVWNPAAQEKPEKDG